MGDFDIKQKQGWKKGDKDRRVKEGSIEDRQLTAEIIKIQRQHGRNVKEIERKMQHDAWMVAVCMLLAAFMMLVFSGKAHAYTDEQAVKAVIGEASGEGYKGMLAVSGAIRNRGTLKGVYGLKSAIVIHHRYSRNTLETAWRAWNDSKHTDISKGAKYWEGTRFPLPYWAKNMRVTAIIGNQRFFSN